MIKAELKKTADKKGFTLMEILIVGMILSVLASLAFVNYSAVMEKARAKAAESYLLAIWAQDQREAMENDGLPTTVFPSDASVGCAASLEGFIGPFCTDAVGPGPGGRCRIYQVLRNSEKWGYLLTVFSFYNPGVKVNSLPTIQCNATPPTICSKLGY